MACRPCRPVFGKPFPRYHFKGFAVRRLCGLHCFAILRLGQAVYGLRRALHGLGLGRFPGTRPRPAASPCRRSDISGGNILSRLASRRGKPLFRRPSGRACLQAWHSCMWCRSAWRFPCVVAAYSPFVRVSRLGPVAHTPVVPPIDCGCRGTLPDFPGHSYRQKKPAFTRAC